MIFRILALGDVAGPNAAARITRELFDIRRRNEIDFVVCNGENSAATNGMAASVRKILPQSRATPNGKAAAAKCT